MFTLIYICVVRLIFTTVFKILQEAPQKGKGADGNPGGCGNGGILAAELPREQ